MSTENPFIARRTRSFGAVLLTQLRRQSVLWLHLSILFRTMMPYTASIGPGVGAGRGGNQLERI